MADAPRRSLPSSRLCPAPGVELGPASGGQFANINRPIAGPTHDKALPVGEHPLQLYSLGTPNGQKVTILLEELLAAGHAGAEYDAWYIDIGEATSSARVHRLNPNSKIPALLDRSDPEKPQRVFESGSILLYLAEKFGAFLPRDRRRDRGAQLAVLADGFGPSWAAVSAISTCMRRSRSNMRSTATRWRPSGSSTCSTAISPSIATPPATSTASPTWRSGLVRAVALGQAYGDAATFLSTSDYRHFNRWVESGEAGSAARAAGQPQGGE